MPKTDLDQLDLIKEAMKKQEKPIERVVVVNSGAKPEYFTHVREIFDVAESDLEMHNAGFCAFAARL